MNGDYEKKRKLPCENDDYEHFKYRRLSELDSTCQLGARTRPCCDRATQAEQNDTQVQEPQEHTLASLIAEIRRETQVRRDTINYIETASETSRREMDDDIERVHAFSLGINLDISYEYNGVNLMALPFYEANPRQYGRRLLDMLFTEEEMATCSFETPRSVKPPLDPVRCNILKACFLRKFKTVKRFHEQWPDVFKGLRKKCFYHASKRNKRKLQQPVPWEAAENIKKAFEVINNLILMAKHVEFIHAFADQQSKKLWTNFYHS